MTVDLASGGVVCKNCYQEGFIFNEKALKLLCLLNKIDLSKVSMMEITDYDIFKEIDDFIHEYYSIYTGIYLNKKDKLMKF